MKKVVGFKTNKWMCSSCNRHYITIPTMENLNKGSICVCGNTSFEKSPGRLIGKKSQIFEDWLDIYNYCKNSISEKELGVIYREED